MVSHLDLSVTLLHPLRDDFLDSPLRSCASVLSFQGKVSSYSPGWLRSPYVALCRAGLRPHQSCLSLSLSAAGIMRVNYRSASEHFIPSVCHRQGLARLSHPGLRPGSSADCPLHTKGKAAAAHTLPSWYRAPCQPPPLHRHPARKGHSLNKEVFFSVLSRIA